MLALAAISACSRRPPPSESVRDAREAETTPDAALASPEPAIHALARPKDRATSFAVLTSVAREEARRASIDAGVIEIRDAREWLVPAGEARDRMTEGMSPADR